MCFFEGTDHFCKQDRILKKRTKYKSPLERGGLRVGLREGRGVSARANLFCQICLFCRSFY